MQIIEELNGGKVILIGDFTAYGTTAAPGIAIIDEAGMIQTDAQTNLGSAANGPINSVQKLDDGNLILSGSFTEFNGEAVSGAVALSPDGSINRELTNTLSEDAINPVLVTGEDAFDPAEDADAQAPDSPATTSCRRHGKQRNSRRPAEITDCAKQRKRGKK